MNESLHLLARIIKSKYQEKENAKHLLKRICTLQLNENQG